MRERYKDKIHHSSNITHHSLHITHYKSPISFQLSPNDCQSARRMTVLTVTSYNRKTMNGFAADKTYGLYADGANKKISRRIEAVGARVISLPAVSFEEIELDEAARNAFDNLFDFDWIVLESVFAADYFLTALERRAIDFHELDALRVCAFGESIADRLRFAQMHADVISSRIDANEVFEALKNYETDLANRKILIPTECGSRAKIAGYLSAANSIVCEVPLYRTRVEEPEKAAKFKALLTGGAIDEFVFAAPGEVYEFARWLEAEELASFVGESAVSAIDQATAQALREFGLTQIGSFDFHQAQAKF